MKKTVIIIAAVLALGWYGDYYCKQNGLPLKDGIPHMFNSVKDSLFSTQNKPHTLTETVPYADVSKPERYSNKTQFRCDGRTRCSQMTSCEEAMFFINNCPDTKMDGDNDGIPCESQWCN
ncbi:MAG: excalibur calcium-binding domain-containing protein [Desulfococcaceae bacterium]